MSKAQIVRKSFNGGEIAPELHYRSDLETYHNSCKSLKNMTVTPWGSAIRRPPSELLAKIDTAVYGVPLKYLPFRFSLTEVFHIIFTDGSGSASADATTADFIVYNQSGQLQVLDGFSTLIGTTVYDPEDLFKLHHIQVNDFIYMTCGGLYPVQSLNRFFSSTWGGQRWKFSEFELFGGPMGEENTRRASVLSANADLYNSGTTYAEGDVVFKTGTVHTIGAVSAIEISKNYDFVNITTSTAHGYVVNNSVYIKGVRINGQLIDGVHTVIKIISTTSFRISVIGSSSSLDPDAQTYKAGSVFGFYTSTQDANTGNALTNTAWWTELEFWAGEIEISSASGEFNSADVGRLLSIRNERFSSSSFQWVANQVSQVFPLYGDIRLTTEGGAWKGVLELQESNDGGATFDTIGTIRSAAGLSNGSIEREVSMGNLVRVELKEHVGQSGYTLNACAWKIESLAPYYSYFKITAFNTIYSVQADCITPILAPISDHRWRFGAFSGRTGYPKSLTIHDERMVLGGSDEKRNTVWASRVNDWTNFVEGDTDVSPYTFTTKADSFDSIRWMRSARDLMIGTDNSETTMGTRDSSEVISPSNVDVSTQTYFGSSNIQAVVTADLVFFVQGQGRRVRSSQYDFGTDQYLSSEMSILAHHITNPGIKEMSYRRHPFSSIFFVLNDGSAVSFTYERDNKVKGWARVTLGGAGEILSASSNYSDAGDIIASIVQRGSEYTLETFGSFDAGSVYLDGQTQSASGWAAGKLLPHADTTGLVVVMDDVLLTEGTDYTWSGSTLTIPGHTDETVTVGWPFAFEIEPTDIIELGDHGAQKRISKLGLYLLESGSCDIEVNGEDCPFQQGDLLTAGERLNGEHQVSVGGGTESAIRIKFSGNHHKPFNLSAFGVFGQPSR